MLILREICSFDNCNGIEFKKKTIFVLVLTKEKKEKIWQSYDKSPYTHRELQ